MSLLTCSQALAAFGHAPSWVAAVWLVGATAAPAAELLGEGAVPLQWPGRCAEQVPVTTDRAGRQAMAELALPALQALIDRAAAAVRQRCPEARQMRFDLPRAGLASVVNLGPSQAPAQTPTLAAGAASPPVTAGRGNAQAWLRPSSALPALTSAPNRTAQCGVLAQWLETTAVRPGQSASRGVPAAEAVDAFRDEHLLAVFGHTYDEGGGGWREKVFQSTVGPCIQPGMAAQPRNALGILRGLVEGAPPEPNSPEVRRTQAFAHVLRSTFGGQPGALTPEAIQAHLQQVRLHYQAANALAEAAQASATDLARFKALDPAGAELRGLRLLSAADRQRLVELLNQRRNALALPLSQAWLAAAEALPRTADSALLLRREQQERAEVLALLPAEQRSALLARLDVLLEAQLADELRAHEARLTGFEASEAGAQALAVWGRSFQPRLSEFPQLQGVQRVRQAWLDARARVLAPLLPGWRQRLAAMPASSAEVAARRADLVEWFGTEPALQGPLYGEFKQALDARELAVRQQLDQDEQARVQQARQAQRASGEGGAAMQAQDFKRPPGRGGEALAAVFEGRFSQVGLEPPSLAFRSLVNGYMRGYSQRCRPHIADPVELTRSECERESVTTRGIGMYQHETSRTCVAWREVPTGVFAERSLYQATLANPMETATGGLREVMDMVNVTGRGGTNPLAAATQTAQQLQALGNAGQQISADNACEAPALKRLRVNLENYLQGRPAMALDGGTVLGVALLPATAGEPYRDSNYARLLDDLVAANAASWGFNRYVPGSIVGATVVQRDAGSRPAVLRASYRFQGLAGSQLGTVTLELQEGRPRCLYFKDAPQQCRTPSAGVAERYVAGGYR